MPYNDGQVAADYIPEFSRDPLPDFDACANCGADAQAACFWDPADGWCCLNCGACDADE